MIVRRRLCIAFIVGFWALVTVGGAVNEGYRQYEDFISSLAARGGEYQWIGIAALLLVAAAHLVVVPDLWRQDRIVGIGVLVAGLMLVVVAASPTGCPGALYCGPSDSPDVLDRLHVVGVLAYTTSLTVAMIRAGVVAMRRPLWRTWGMASIAAAAVFLITLAMTQGSTPGLSQRFWVLAGQVWLVVAASVPFARDPGTIRHPSRVGAGD